MILSTVRSQPLEEINNEAYMEHDRLWMKENLGFITDEHQICVGITRSKYGLIITGKSCFIDGAHDFETDHPQVTRPC